MRSIGRAVVDLHPEVLAGEKFVDGSSWSAGETIWITRTKRGVVVHPGPEWFSVERPEEPYSDLVMTGELASGVARMVGTLIRDSAVPGMNPELLDLFSEYWEKLAYNLRIYSISDQHLP